MASPDPPEDESETSHYRSLVTWDTEYSADSVEWCPISPFQEILAIGTYQVDKSSQEKFSPGQRKGRIYLHKFNPDSNTSVLTQTLETAAILDMKWCPHAIGSDKVVLATVDAAATLTIYQLIRSTEHLEKLSDLKLRPEDDALALSLDFSSRKSPDPTPLISVSDSKGGVTLVRMSGDLTVISTVPDCHRFEAWITAFDAWNSKLFFTGGDDSKLKGFCLDDGTETARPVFTIGKEHMAGVTSLLSDVYREHRLYSGSYDDYLRTWDTRQTKQPLESLHLGGGVWRIKQLVRDPSGSDPHGFLATASMANGFHIIDHSKSRIIAHYTEHESLGYGVDWSPSVSSSNCFTLATCSFYDHLLKIWSFVS